MPETENFKILFYQVSVFAFLFVLYMTGLLNVLFEKEVSELNDKKIIAAIAARDERMLAFVVQKYSKLLWKIAASVLINAASVQDVEECVADVFIYLWQYPEKYDPEKAKLSSWLSVVARSKAVDSYRRIIRKREISIEDIVVESLGYAENNTAYEVMEAAFESSSGNFIVVDLGDGVTVIYGHLKEIRVSESEEIKQGQVIATLGQTGMATGPNLLFAVSINGEEVNPFVE